MLSTVCSYLPKTIATLSAADLSCMAVALTERPAGFVSFQRHQPGFSPVKIVNSADASLSPTYHFSGNYAISATNAVTTATFTAF